MPSSPFLLIPGLNCTPRLFAGVLPDLWQFGPVTIADHRNGVTMQEIAASILANAPPKFTLLGFSMGGYVSFEILRQAPDRVQRLVLIDTSARPDTPEQTERRRAQIEKAQTGHFDVVPRQQYPGLVHGSHLETEAIRSVHIAMAVETGPDSFVRQQTAIIGRVDSRPGLSAIHCPTLVLVGEADQVTPPEAAEEMAAGIAGAMLVEISEAGHLSPLEQPEQISVALSRWLSRNPVQFEAN